MWTYPQPYVSVVLSSAEPPFRLEEQAIRALPEALARLEPSLIIEAEDPAGWNDGARLFVDSCRGQPVIPALVLRVRDAKAITGEAHCPRVITIALESVADEAEAIAAAQALYDGGTTVDLRTWADGPAGRIGGATEANGVWRVVGPLGRNEWEAAPVLVVGVDGRGRRHTGAGGSELVTSTELHRMSAEQVRAELELPPSSLMAAGRRPPLHMPFPAANGKKLRRYWQGGTQALGHALTQAETKAAFAFDDDDAYTTWLDEVAQDGELANSFPVFPGMVKMGGVFEDGARVVRPPSDHRARTILAAWIARGQRDHVASYLGISSGFFDGQTKGCLSSLTDGELKPYVEAATHVFAGALYVIGRSPIDIERRREAVRPLNFLGNIQAKRLAWWLATNVPGLEALKEQAGLPGVRRRAKAAHASSPKALAFLEEAIRDACSVFEPRPAAANTTPTAGSSRSGQ